MTQQTEANYAPVQHEDPATAPEHWAEQPAEAAPAQPSWWQRRRAKRAERRQRLAMMSDYERWRRGLRIRRTIGVLLILGIVGAIAYVVFGTDLGSQAMATAEPVLGPAMNLLSDVREDPRKGIAALGALLITKIGLLFLLEDMFDPNARR